MTEQPEMDLLRAEIVETRDQLADTVDQLTDKLDVKAQASKKAQHAVDAASEKAHELAGKAQPVVAAVQQNRTPALAATAAITIALIVLIFRSKRHS